MTKAMVKKNLNEGELLKDYLTAGDEDSFTELTHRHLPMILNVARYVLGDAHKAHDVAQAAFLALIRKGDRLQESTSVEAWLHKAAVCLARDERLKELRRKRHEREPAMHDIEPEERSVPSEPLLAALHEELANFSGEQRKTILLHHIQGLNYAEAASRCACTPNAFSVSGLGANPFDRGLLQAPLYLAGAIVP